MHLDETSLPFPSAAAGGQQEPTAMGPLSSITLSDNVDMTALLEHDAAGNLSFGPHASIRFDAWIPPPSQTNDISLCVPSSLTLVGGPGSVTVPVPPPAHGGWAAGKWHSIDAPIKKEDGAYLDDGGNATWHALTRLEMDYQCRGINTETATMTTSGSTTTISASSSTSIKIQLVRVCKALPSPSFCTIASTDVYKTECRQCNCQTCHKEDCKCLTTTQESCLSDECDMCPSAPFCKCCYDSACSYPCNCETCCESRSFTSCAAAISYGVASLAPAAGLEEGGAHVLVRATTTFVATPNMACRFGFGAAEEGKEEGWEGGREGGVIVPATLLSPFTMACVAPPFDGEAMSENKSSNSSGGGRSMVVEVSLDGQQWTCSGRTFHYCPSSSSSSSSVGWKDDEHKKDECLASHHSCLPGWTGTHCNLECPGGAINPCHGGGFCIAAVVAGVEEASCACRAGYEGAACEMAATTTTTSTSTSSSSSKIVSKAVTPSSSFSDPIDDANSTASTAVRQGLMLGVGACLLLLTLAGVAVYVKRAEVGEFVYWSLAASRFERLQQQEEGQGGDGSVGEVKEGRGGRRSVELTVPGPQSLLRQEDDGEQGEVTIM